MLRTSAARTSSAATASGSSTARTKFPAWSRIWASSEAKSGSSSSRPSLRRASERSRGTGGSSTAVRQSARTRCAVSRVARVSGASAMGGSDTIESAPVDRCVSGSNDRIEARVALVEERLGDARGRPLVARRERARTLFEVIRRRQAPEQVSRRDDEKIHRAFREARQRPELLAPHFQRRRDLLVGRERGRRKKRHALLAENARGVARKRGGIAFVCEHDEPSQSERRADGLEEVGQKAGGRPRQRHTPRRRPEDPRLDPPGQTLHRGCGGERLKQRIPPPRHAWIMAEATARLLDPRFPARNRPQTSPEGPLVSLVPWLSLVRLDYCDERALPSV